MSVTPELIHRPSATRGHAHHGWLKTAHTFSFASYYSDIPREQAWGSLRVINEDRVTPGNGFPPHPHREFEIFSVVLSGTIAHQDSMGNTEELSRGDYQMTSAGTGIRHAEGNGTKTEEELHFLQCWAVPHTKGLKPAYYTRHFTDEEKRGKLLCTVAPVGSDPSVVDARDAKGPTPIHSNLTMYASILPPGATVSHTFKAGDPRKGYVHLAMIKHGYRGARDPLPTGGPELAVEVEGQSVKLIEGDGVYLDKVQGSTVKFENVGDADAEFVFFDLDD